MKYFILFFLTVVSAYAVTASSGAFSITATSGANGKINVTWNNGSGTGGTNMYYVSGSGQQNTGGAFFSRGPGSSGTLELDATPSAWVLVFASNSVQGQEGNAWFQVMPTGEPTKKVTVSLYNGRDVPVTYKLMQDGVSRGELTLQPRTGAIQTFTVPASSDVTVVELVTGLAQDGDAWVVSEGAVTEVPIATITPTTVPPGGDNPPAPTSPTPSAPGIPNSSSPNVTPTTKPVWNPVTPGSNQTDLLTNPVFREGVDKIVQGQGKCGMELFCPAWCRPTHVADSCLRRA